MPIVRGAAPKSSGEEVAPERDLLGARLRAAFEQSPVSTVVYDAAGHPIAVNRSFERLWGVTLADVPPGYSVLTDPQLEASGIASLVALAFTGQAVATPPVRYDMPATVGRGEVLWTRAHLYPVFDDAGAVQHVVLSHEDVTDRLVSEAARAESAERAERLQAFTAALSTAATPDQVARAVVDHAGGVLNAVGMVIARLASDRQHLIIMGAASMPEEIQSDWRVFSLHAPVPLAEVARTGQPLFLESREEWTARYPQMLPLLEATGHHANAVAPLIVEGRVLGAVGAAYDAPRAFSDVDRALTGTVAQQCAQALERARLFESERSARQEAEEANRAKGEFLAAMSHELRTPLNAIAGHVQLLDMGIYGPVTEEQRQALHRIDRAQRYLLGHVNDVLNFARLSAGRVEFDVRPVVLADLVRDLEPMLAPQIRDKTLGYEAAIGDGECAMADREKLVQVLLNLLSNAIKFTPPGGSIRIECARRADGTDDPRTVFLRVIDTGIGIPADRLDAIFEPFVQVDATPSRRGVGTGLGLSISRALIRGMGGELRVRSTFGSGTSFTVTLPRA